MFQVVAQSQTRVAVMWSRDEIMVNPFDSEPRAACMECAATFASIPDTFIYEDRAAGWRQDPETVACVAGFCRPCATRIAAANHAEYVNGNWERRTIEDELYVWDR